MKWVCLLTTVPRLVMARKLARELVDKKLAACVHITPSGESHYRWKGKLERTREFQLIIKTDAKLLARIATYFKTQHPYEIPEFVALPIRRGASAYLKWLTESLES